MSNKDKQPRISMPEQEPNVRNKNFDEVPLGYEPEMAIAEARRCLQCKKPACVTGCPVEVPIPQFINAIANNDFNEAIKIIWKKNVLPAVCGRVCPQEIQCEGKCIIGKKDEPVAIGNLEKFVADVARNKGTFELSKKPETTRKKVAIIGSGPAGLTVAGDLITFGHEVTVFEAFHKPGGVLVYGIPEFRLPKEIVSSEVDLLERQGVKVKCNNVVGRTVTIDELFEQGYNAIFIGVGAGLPTFLNLPGENLIGIYSANEYLTRANLMKAYRFPEYDTPMPNGKNVVVIGAGNVAMDAARTAKRLGSENVTIVYRRSREEMPARIAEIHHAEEEGIQFKILNSPVNFVSNEKGHVTQMKCLKMKLGEPDASGRKRPNAIKGSEYIMDIDLAIIAVGSGANPLLTRSTEGLELNKWGNILVDKTNNKTSKKAIWAGGDIVTGQATVILAMGAGRIAADSIHKYLMRGW